METALAQFMPFGMPPWAAITIALITLVGTATAAWLNGRKDQDLKKLDLKGQADAREGSHVEKLVARLGELEHKLGCYEAKFAETERQVAALERREAELNRAYSNLTETHNRAIKLACMEINRLRQLLNLAPIRAIDDLPSFSPA